MDRWRVILLGCVSWALSAAANTDGSSVLQADSSLWGVYGELIGTSRQAGDRGYRVTWRWSRPGEEMLEQWSVPSNGVTAYTHRITLGAQPGRLVFSASGLGGGTWDGEIQSDGGVLYIGRGLRKSSHHIGLAADGYLENRPAVVKDGRLVSLAAAHKYLRFALVDTSSVMAPSATANPPDPIPSSVASTTDAPIDPHADRAVWGDYAHIVGREWRGYYDISARWSIPGQEIVEVWKYGPMTPLSAGKTLRKIVIRPGSKPGRLVAVISGSRVEDRRTGKIGKSGGISFGHHRFKLVDANTIEYGGDFFGSYYPQRVFAASSNAGALSQRPAWGAYADLAGQSFQGSAQSTRLLMSFDWLIPGEVLYVLQHTLDDDVVYGELIHVSSEDGSLIARSSPPWNVDARGEVAADGKVSFVTKRTLGMQSRSSLERLGTGQLEFRTDHALASARSWVLSAVANEQVPKIRMAARYQKQQRDRAAEIAKTERSQRRAEFLGNVLSTAETFSQELSPAQARGGSADAQLGDAMGRTLDQLRAQQQSIALAGQYDDDAAASTSTLPLSSSSAGAASFVDGIYAMQDGSYSIDVRRDGADLVVTEPNKVSRYRVHSDGVWHFHNPNVDIVYGLRVIDGRMLEAFKPHQPGAAPTPLYRVGGAAVVELKAVNTDTNAIAERYKRKATEDPDNVQVWSACTLAAYKRAVSPGPVADLYGMQMAQMLKELMTDGSATPCDDAIPAALW